MTTPPGARAVFAFAARPSLVRSISRASSSGTCRSRMSTFAWIATRLGLGFPLIPTKTAGDRFAEFFLLLSSISGTFSKIAAAIHYLDCGGPFPPDVRTIPYTRLRRPIAPLDPNPWL